MFLIRLALRPWRQTFWTQLVAMLSLASLLILGGFLLGFYQGLKPIVARINAEQILTVYVDPSLNSDQEKGLIDRIGLTMGSAPVQIEMTERADFLERLEKRSPELVKEILSLGDEGFALLPRFVTISGKFSGGSDQIRESVLSLRAIEGVESVESSFERFSHVGAAFRVVSRTSLWFGVGIAFAILSLFFLIGRMNHTLFSESLSVMEFWGAGPLLLRLPLLISLLLIGLGSALLAYGLFRWTYFSGIEQVRLFSPLFSDLEIPRMATANGIFIFSFLGSLAMGLLSYARGTSQGNR